MYGAVMRWVVIASLAAGCGFGGSGDSDGSVGDASGTGDGAALDAARPDDAAGADAMPQCSVTACPVAPDGYTLGDPMVEVDPCVFPMQDDDLWAAQYALVDQLEAGATAVSVADVLADLNRDGVVVASTALSSGTDVPDVDWAFAWNSGDNNVAYWIPQGLTGSTDAADAGLVDGKRVAVTTWYYDPAADPSSPGDKGVRISLADITDPADVSYRLLLLVEPFDDDGQVSFREIPIHAGGVVWFGDYLYVADTGVGFRVFDMSRIVQVSTGVDAIGYDAGDQTFYAYSYKYVVPQVGRYRHVSECGPRYSFVALDRSTSPPSLISGEYSSSSPAHRVFRWPLDAATGRLPAGTFYPSEALFMGYTHVQGAVAHDGVFYLSTSEPPAGRGDLATTSVSGPATVGPWVDAPEDLVYDVGSDELWGCGEAVGKRYVFSATVTP